MTILKQVFDMHSIFSVLLFIQFYCHPHPHPHFCSAIMLIHRFLPKPDSIFTLVIFISLSAMSLCVESKGRLTRSFIKSSLVIYRSFSTHTFTGILFHIQKLYAADAVRRENDDRSVCDNPVPRWYPLVRLDRWPMSLCKSIAMPTDSSGAAT